MATREEILSAEHPPPYIIEPDSIPEALTVQPRWFNWKWYWNGKKWTKVPIQSNGSNASSTDPATWTDFPSALATADSGRGTYRLGLGFVFNGDGIVGVDLDDCRDPETGNLHTWAAQVLRDFKTYSEVSPSETGVKLFVIGKLPETFNKQHKRPDGAGEVEIYREGRFFTVTGMRCPGTPSEVNQRPDELAAFYEECCSWKPVRKVEPKTDTPRAPAEQTDDRSKALAALAVINNSGGGLHYEQWVRVGMALHSVDPSDSMLCEWEAWSKQCEKYQEGECSRKWPSFNGQGVGLPTLCFMADESGQDWRPSRPRAEHSSEPTPFDVLDSFVDSMAPEPLEFQPESEQVETPSPIRRPENEQRLRTALRVALRDLDKGKAPEFVALSVQKAAGEISATDEPEFDVETLWSDSDEHTELQRPIVDTLLRAGETMNVISEPKMKKSWLVVSLGLSVATGRKWLDKYYTTLGRVLIIDNELHRATLRNRLPRVATAMGIKPEELKGRFAFKSLRGGLIDLEKLCCRLERLEPGSYDLIILDALYRLIPRGFDENSNADVTALYNMLDNVAMKIGCAFVVVHHSSKGNQASKSVTDVGAGAGAAARAADTHLILRQHETDDVAVVACAVRSWKPQDPFCIRWDHPLWTDAPEFSPDDIKREKPRRGSATPKSKEDAETEKFNSEKDAQEKLLEACRQHPEGETKSVLRDITKFNESKFNKVIGQLKELGLVFECKFVKARNEVKGYRLTEVSQVSQVSHDRPDRAGQIRSVSRPLKGGDRLTDLTDRLGVDRADRPEDDLPTLDGLPDMDMR